MEETAVAKRSGPEAPTAEVAKFPMSFEANEWLKPPSGGRRSCHEDYD